MLCEDHFAKGSCLLSELNSDIRLLKEEIRSAFAKHKNCMVSRENYLLDQVDSIKEATTSMIMKQQMTLTEVKARLAECSEHLKQSNEQKEDRGMQRALAVIAELRNKAEKCDMAKRTALSKVKFVHDSNKLQNNILSYGKLETCIDANAEHSWDVVEDKDDCDSFISYEPSSCSKLCCKSSNEIEDMDFFCIHSGDEFDAEELDLSQVCKANELCTAISECVCDSPCTTKGRKAQITMLKNAEKYSKKTAFPSKTPDDCFDMRETKGNDPLLAIRKAVNDILSPTNTIAFTTASLKKAETNEIVMDGLTFKLQGILDGKDVIDRSHESVESKKLAETVEDDRVKPCNVCPVDLAPIDCLHNKIQGILDGTSDVVTVCDHDMEVDDKEKSGVESTVRSTDCKSENVPSFISDLASKLQGIFDGTFEPKTESDDAGHDTCMDFKQQSMGSDLTPLNETEKFADIDSLHRKLQDIIGIGLPEDVKVNPVPETVNDGLVSDLHSRLVEILQTEASPITNESARISMDPDPISVISHHMRSLLSD